MNSFRYPLPWTVAYRLALSVLRGRERSINSDGKLSQAILPDGLQVHGRENIPQAGPLLVTCNHYTRPGLPAWWMTLVISAELPYPIHWVITSEYTFKDHPLQKLLNPASRIVFKRVARAYGFTSMPPMPPDPSQQADRARAVRQVLRFAKSNREAVIGIAPEGRDSSNSALQRPFPGTGRFLAHLAVLGFEVLPAGLFEDGRNFCLRFGSPYRIEIDLEQPADRLDGAVIDCVMSRIAAVLPHHLRGEWVGKP